MFHAKDGWFFEHLPDGSVHIVKRETPHDNAWVDEEVTFTPETWASIVASVSAKGEADRRWYQALDFHRGETSDTDKQIGLLKTTVAQMSEKLTKCVELIRPAYDLCQQIEICGASVELTKAVTMAADIMHGLMDATGVQQLPPDKTI